MRAKLLEPGDFVVVERGRRDELKVGIVKEIQLRNRKHDRVKCGLVGTPIHKPRPDGKLLRGDVTNTAMFKEDKVKRRLDDEAEARRTAVRIEADKVVAGNAGVDEFLKEL